MKKKILKNSLLSMMMALSMGSSFSIAERPPEGWNILTTMVVKIPLFVQWPNTRVERFDGKIAFCTLGALYFDQMLEIMSPADLDRYNFYSLANISEVDDQCDVVFVAPSKRPSLSYIVEQLSGRAIFTVSTIPRFTDYGGMVGLSVVDRRISLEINVESIKGSGLMVDSMLLKMAK